MAKKKEEIPVEKIEETRENISPKKTIIKKTDNKVPDTMKIIGEREIAYDFALKLYNQYDQMIKSVVLFGSAAKRESLPSSDIDIMVIVDDVSVRWDDELIAWYREELAKQIKLNPYVRPLHINTIKLSNWWEDVMRGDPVVVNIIRSGDPLIDFGGFFEPLKVLLEQGKIRSTPESIYTLLQRAPRHLARARQSMLAAVDGLYWTMIDSAHAALISINVSPASPEHIPEVLMEKIVKTKKLDKKFVKDYDEIHSIAKDIIHGKITFIEGKYLDEWFEKADKFLKEMTRIVDESVKEK